MSLERDRRISALADAFMMGRIRRRSFISGLLGVGLAPTVAGAIVAAASSRESALAAQTSVPSDVSGEIRFMIGPWTDQEVEHQQKIAAAFNKLFPNVKF
ncbi:MAG TPA: hypothetical protein VFX03_12055, partial [Thermomicrobiales bacterium]|nr:hypothetical protein [Thermomicrobiales bacterium]